MSRGATKRVLFLCTGNYYRSRFAEAVFNHVAGRMGVPWRAGSRGLALERGVNNVGPMAKSALAALETLGVRAGAECARLPETVTTADLEAAALVVALKDAEHRPLLAERFPDWAERVEYWHVDDAPAALGEIEREVHDLLARLLGGGPRCPEPVAPAVEQAPKPPIKPAATVRVGRETKGRRGKGVTLVWDLPLDDAGVQALAATLKQKCGTGGTVKDGRIEIQGDHRDRLAAELEKLGYKVKRDGG
jgi:predicted translation initiation factor SUI1